jgi:hypothetical protein
MGLRKIAPMQPSIAAALSSSACLSGRSATQRASACSCDSSGSIAMRGGMAPPLFEMAREALFQLLIGLMLPIGPKVRIFDSGIRFGVRLAPT